MVQMYPLILEADRVVGIDLCFKLNDSNIVNVIEKFNKEEQGLGGQYQRANH
jgi:hypothetical protein